MAQIFHPSMNVVAKACIAALVIGVCGAALIGSLLDRSPYVTNQGVIRDQPVPFSHAHQCARSGPRLPVLPHLRHRSTFAGLPATKTCMTCHSRIWTGCPDSRAGPKKLER